MKFNKAEIIEGAWRKPTLQWKLDALQRHMTTVVKSKSDARKVCILSSRQIGKSYWCIAFAIEYLLSNPGKIVRVVAPTLKNCNNIVADNLNAIVSDAPEGLITRNRSELRWNFSNGSSLRLGALERAHVDNMNRGGNASVVIYEECGFVSADDFTYGVDSVLGPQLLRSGGYEIFVSSPPVDPDHPLIIKKMEECQRLGTSFEFSVFDSPSITPPLILEAMERSGCKITKIMQQAVLDGLVNRDNIISIAATTGSIISESFLREYCAFVIRSSTLMVVPHFDHKKHVQVFDDPAYCFWNVTTDWGGVLDKTCALLHTYDPVTNWHFVRSELVYEPNTDTPTIAAGLVQLGKKREIAHRYADVHGQTQVDLDAMGYLVSKPVKTDWLGAVQAMDSVFVQDRILIHPDCEFLIMSLRSGMFNKAKTDFARSEKLGHCDGLAALMYAIRCADLSNPYKTKTDGKNLYQKFEEPIDYALAKALSPRGFGRYG